MATNLWSGAVIAEPGEVTQLLLELRAGNRAAEEKLVPLVYAELRVYKLHNLHFLHNCLRLS
jgi:hypothetical protein